MGRLRLWVVLAIVTGGFAVSAVAAVGPQQRTDPVTAVLAANRVGVPYERTCAGEDGQYRQAVEMYAGSVSGDPRLTGMATMVLTTFTSVSTGNGTGAGTVVVKETGGAIRFKAEASAWTPSAVQLQQVWVDPPVRRRGYAERALRDLIRLLLTEVPAVCLFVRAENTPAIRLYETVGMKHVLDYRSVLF